MIDALVYYDLSGVLRLRRTRAGTTIFSPKKFYRLTWRPVLCSPPPWQGCSCSSIPPKLPPARESRPADRARCARIRSPTLPWLAEASPDEPRHDEVSTLSFFCQERNGGGGREEFFCRLVSLKN